MKGWSFSNKALRLLIYIIYIHEILEHIKINHLKVIDILIIYKYKEMEPIYINHLEFKIYIVYTIQ